MSVNSRCGVSRPDRAVGVPVRSVYVYARYVVRGVIYVSVLVLVSRQRVSPIICDFDIERIMNLRISSTLIFMD